jgi:endogenous inhibitor of DNA gyrase (YacG/DUF329 family)
VPCPICHRDAPREGNRFFPFCSERCKLIDLGKWLGEEYRIPVAAEDGPPSEDEDATADGDRERP